MKTKTRCKECKWVHEADSIKGTSFMGVEPCPLHAAAPKLLEAVKQMRDMLLDHDVDMTEINALVAKLEGK